MGKKKRVLTWHGYFNGRKGGRWKKQILGKVHFFGTGESPDDLKAYRVAEKAYFEFMQRLEATTPVDVQVADATIADICEKFLQQLEARYKRNDVSADHFERCRCDLNDFAAHVGPGKKMSCLGELDLEDYRNHTLNRPQSNSTGRRIAPKTAKGRLGSVRTMIRWGWKMSIIDKMPRNLEDIAKVPNGGQPKVLRFTLDELKTLWELANDRLRCWIALALNCGMGQQDITDLKVGEW